MAKKEAIKLAKKDAKNNGLEYAVIKYGNGYAVFTLQTAMVNGEKIIYRTDKFYIQS